MHFVFTAQLLLFLFTDTALVRLKNNADDCLAT